MTSLASFQGQLLKQESGQCDSCLSPGGRAVERGPEHWHSSGAGLGLCPREGGREGVSPILQGFFPTPLSLD